jgi:hypothetical protein
VVLIELNLPLVNFGITESAEPGSCKLNPGNTEISVNTYNIIRTQYVLQRGIWGVISETLKHVPA